MFFKENLDFNETNLDYGVLKTNNRQYLPTKLVTTSVPHSNCRLSCRASVSDIVPLKEQVNNLECIKIQHHSFVTKL